MPEYIEREALIAEFDAAVENNGMGYVIGQTLKRYVKRQPAADVVSRATLEQFVWERDVAMEQLKEHGIPFGGKADVVAVVRCKECKIQQMCRLAQRLGDDGFCSEGERRGEDAI